MMRVPSEKEHTLDWIVARSKAVVLAVLVASMVISATAQVRGQGAVELTLADALVRALEHNESYLISEQEQRRGEARVTEARADALPKLSFFGNYSRNFEIPEQFVKIDWDATDTVPPQISRFKFGFEHTAIWGVSARQTIFEGGRVFAALAAARLYAKYLTQAHRQARLDLQRDVSLAFYDAILAAQRVEVARQALQLATQTRDVVQQRFDQGQSSEYDLLRAKVQVANIQPEVTQADNLRQLSLTNLRNLLGINAGVPLVLQLSYPDSAAWENEPLDTLLDRARARRPEPLQAELEVRMRQKAVSVAAADHYPSLYLSTDWAISANRERLGMNHWLRTPSWSATLSLSIPIFEGMRVSSGVAQAKVDLSQARLRESAINKYVALDVEKAGHDFIEARERLASQSETVHQAEEGYQIAQLRYQEGVGTQLEVTDALVALTTARLNQSQALRDVLVARVQLRRAVGEPVLTGLESEKE